MLNEPSDISKSVNKSGYVDKNKKGPYLQSSVWCSSLNQPRLLGQGQVLWRTNSLNFFFTIYIYIYISSEGNRSNLHAPDAYVTAAEEHSWPFETEVDAMRRSSAPSKLQKNTGIHSSSPEHTIRSLSSLPLRNICVRLHFALTAQKENILVCAAINFINVAAALILCRGVRQCAQLFVSVWESQAAPRNSCCRSSSGIFVRR